ncbi:response regulator [Aliifodinibius sp. S!AR15-10]|uniref:response regulator n=1 Tax=Aliifodinibius sp. S!AR15-10 TaxID=2950437 RepID=UPI00285EE186|nr:response regulator [Aliifodinibius sp. S!AR15-10]MDR8391341.1 response regulator [Aliifodinibius sp. S!AR15-10]
MGKSILIIDDDQTIREALSLFLAGEGFSCTVAKDGAEAVEEILAHSFDIILLDLRLPRRNGLNILQEVKRLSADSIIIILTAYYSIDEATLALQEGASQLLLKPIDFEELLEAITQSLDLKKAT